MSELPWTSPEWLSEATAWIRERADVAGDIEQPHVRPWSTVLRVPTTDGDLYFKAVSAVHVFEAALTGLLAELQPGRGFPTSGSLYCPNTSVNCSPPIPRG